MSATAALKIAFRVLLITVLFTMLGFALGGLLGVLSISIMAAAHMPIKVQDAIWFGAVPGGLLGGVAGFVVITISEKHSRRGY